MVLPLNYATHFQLWQRGADRAVLVLGAGGSQDTIARFLISDRTGPTAMPWRGDYSLLPAVTPRAVLLSTTHVPFVDALGAVENILACAWPEKLRSQTFLEALASGEVRTLVQNPEARREQLVSLSPDLVLDHPFGQTLYPKGPSGAWVPVCEYLEEHPLARAEWIRFFGVLFRRQEKADDLFRAVHERYTRVAALVPPTTLRPLVFFGSAWQGTWSVPAGNSCMARLIDDAGGNYLYAGRASTGNLDLHLETVIADAYRADHWGMIVDVPDARVLRELPGMDARLLAAPALSERDPFVANSAESDLFGKALLEPDIALADLISILHPDLLPDHRPVYYRPLPQ